MEDKTDSHKHEVRHARLRALADSINDTARMARGTLSLVLLAALYLGLTLLSSTDENLLRNGKVLLPQVGVGVSVVQSYFFAPLIFFYLHGHALLMLTVLARKVRTFESALSDEFTTQDAKKKECRDWLSAFTFVQTFRQDTGVWHVSKAFAWLSINAIPLLLLFVIDVSFVRYQHEGITWFHHTVFVLDLLFLVYFNLSVFGGNWRVMFAGNREKKPRRIWILANWAVTLVKGMVAFGMLLLILFAAQPPSEIEDRDHIWQDEYLYQNEGFWGAVRNGENLLDSGPCKWWDWRQTCRYLDVSNKWLVETKPYKQNKLCKKEDLEDRQRELHLVERKLRFANFRSARLQYADLRNAQLQGADFGKAQLYGADLEGAHLEGAALAYANLENANLKDAHLEGATLAYANLENANLKDAHLEGATLEYANLECARLNIGNLNDVTNSLSPKATLSFLITGLDTLTNLKKTVLQGASLRNAYLKYTNFQEADVRYADLRNAYLYNSNFQKADLRGAKLQKASLRGANLLKARLRSANFLEADLRETRGIICRQLKRAQKLGEGVP